MSNASRAPVPEASSANTPWAWVRTRELEGDFPGDSSSGIWPLNYNRVRRGWGDIPDWQVALTWPPPPASPHDDAAKAHRIDSYSRIWSFRDCKAAFSRAGEIWTSLLVTDQWRAPPEGKLDFDQDHLPILGGHSMRMVPSIFLAKCPLDWEEEECLVAPNTWGASWGNAGWAALSERFFDRYMYSAWSIEDEWKMPEVFGSGIQQISWPRARSAERIALALDILDVDADERMAWALLTIRRGELHVEDLFVKPDQRGKGYGHALMEGVFHTASTCLPQSLTPRFWIDFADVETPARAEATARWFSRYGLRIERSPRRWAAYTATPGKPVRELPTIELPPKPAYCFSDAPAAAPRSRSEHITDERLEQLRDHHGVSHDFMEIAKGVLADHAEVLRRLS